MKIKKINCSVLSPMSDIVIFTSANKDVDVLKNVYVSDESGKLVHVYDYYLEKYINI